MRRWLIGGGIALALLVAGTVVAIVAVGGDDADGAADDPQAAMTAFRDCMAEQGAELPEPPEGAPAPGGEIPIPEGGIPEGGPPQGGVMIQPGGESEADREALEACADLLPAPAEGAQPGFRLAPQS